MAERTLAQEISDLMVLGHNLDRATELAVADRARLTPAGKYQQIFDSYCII